MEVCFAVIIHDEVIGSDVRRLSAIRLLSKLLSEDRGVSIQMLLVNLGQR